MGETVQPIYATHPDGCFEPWRLVLAVRAADVVDVASHRLTLEQMLARFAALSAAEQAARDAQARTLDAALDAICELQAAWLLDNALREPRDKVVAAWARETLALELAPSQPVPAAIWGAFRRSQTALWAGEPVTDVLALLGNDEPGPQPVVHLADWS